MLVGGVISVYEWGLGLCSCVVVWFYLGEKFLVSVCLMSLVVMNVRMLV